MRSGGRTYWAGSYEGPVARSGIYWFAGFAIGLVAYLLPEYVTPDASRAAKLLITGCVLLFAAGILGYLMPRRPWRWAVATVFPIPIAVALTGVSEHSSLTGASFWNTLVATLSADATVFLALLGVALVGALLGSLMETKSLVT